MLANTDTMKVFNSAHNAKGFKALAVRTNISKLPYPKKTVPLDMLNITISSLENVGFETLDIIDKAFLNLELHDEWNGIKDFIAKPQ